MSKRPSSQRSHPAVEVLFSDSASFYGAVKVDSSEDLLSPFGGEPFSCLLWDHEGSFGSEERIAVASSLLSYGCRYAVCGGKRVREWHDAIDSVYLSRLGHELQGSDEDYLITTWHEGEGPAEVAFFFVFNVDDDDADFDHKLILHIGGGEDQALLETAVRDFASGERELP